MPRLPFQISKPEDVKEPKVSAKKPKPKKTKRKAKDPTAKERTSNLRKCLCCGSLDNSCGGQWKWTACSSYIQGVSIKLLSQRETERKRQKLEKLNRKSEK